MLVTSADARRGASSAKANQAAIGSDPGDLQVGMTLVMPDASKLSS